jgi:hypothetical protein
MQADGASGCSVASKLSESASKIQWVALEHPVVLEVFLRMVDRLKASDEAKAADAAQGQAQADR